MQSIMTQHCNFRIVVNIISAVLVLASFTKADHPEVLYFSNLQNIQVYNNHTTNIIFRDTLLANLVDCNPNPRDRRIYWSDLPGLTGVIMRGIPNDPSSIEPIISRDIIFPYGLAIDWVTNNIYFSQQRYGQNTGRIEVASGDGQRRKVLFNNLVFPGALAINSRTGHLYFFDNVNLYRSPMDGNNNEKIQIFNGHYFHIFNRENLKTLTVDIGNNVIYWTQDNCIKCLSMNAFNALSNPADLVTSGLIQTVVQSNTRLFDVSIHGNSLYWTLLRTIGDNHTVTDPGALYRGEMVGANQINQTEVLFESNDISPHGVCTFYNVSAMSSPCSEGRNPCAPSAFCFIVPDGEGGTRAKCGCPTGLTLNLDNVSCPSVPHDFLLFSHVFPSQEEPYIISHTELNMISLDEGSTDQQNFTDVNLPIDLTSQDARSITYDPIRHKVYWTVVDPPAIMRANLNGTHLEVFINTSVGQLESLAVDPYSGNLYWADSKLNRISVARIDNPFIRRTLFTNIKVPRGLALDIPRGLMYWTDRDNSRQVVEKARMDGRDRVPLPRLPDDIIQTPTNVAVDPETGYVYWIKVSRETGRTSVVYFDGRTEYDVPITGLRTAFSLAINGPYVYWTDIFSTSTPIGRAPKTHSIAGGSMGLLTGIGGIYGLVAVNSSTQIVDTGCHFSNERGGNTICLPSGNISEPTYVCSDNKRPSSDGVTRCIDPEPLLFIANNTHITRLEQATLRWVIGSTVFSLGNATANVKALDVDVRENMIYWIDSKSKMIFRQRANASMDSVPEKVVSCCLLAPEDIAVDWFGRNLYWGDSGRRVIELSKLNGDNRVILTTIPEDVEEGPSHIVLDPIRGHIYWSCKSEPKIFRTRMDGTQSQHELFRQHPMRTSRIFALSFNFSEVGNAELFWAINVSESPSTSYRILRTSVLNTDVSSYSVALNGYTSQILDLQMANNGAIFIDALRGSFHTIAMTDRNGQNAQNTAYSPLPNEIFSRFVVLHHSVQPGVHLCSEDRCNANALCLVTNASAKVCRCSPLEVQTHTSDNNPLTSDDSCFATRSVLVLATEGGFYSLPVPPVAHSRGNVQRLPIVPQGRVLQLDFDPLNNSVLWVESGSNMLHSVALNSQSDYTYPLSNVSDLRPFSFAFDWRGGQLVLTEEDGFQLSLVVPEGNRHGLLLNLTVNRLSPLKKPGEVVFDSYTSTLYWTNRDGQNNTGRELNYLHLSNLQDIRTISLDGRRISNLTFGNASRSLYWINHMSSGQASIEFYNIATREISLVAEQAEHIEAMAAISVEDAGQVVEYIYWYNRTDQIIYRHGNGSTEQYVAFYTSERVVSMVGHRSLENTPIHSCRSPRPCSHICVPDQAISSHTCHCPVFSRLESGHTCTAPLCRSFELSCGDDFDNCLPSVYFCDGIRHCPNGIDEENCNCNLTRENGCYSENRSEPVTCYAHNQRCDGMEQCPNGQDELNCCSEDKFSCYVNGSGRNSVPYFECLFNNFKCDGMPDCADGRDEMGCPIRISSTDSSSTSPSTTQLPVIVSAVIISVIIVVVAVVIITFVAAVFWKKRNNYRITHGMPLSQTPPIRTDSQSDYNSEFTNTTLTHNVSTSPCGDKNHNHNLGSPYDMMINPPPSPTSTLPTHPRHSLPLHDEDDDISTFSQTYSESTFPRGPCPSINYDNLSQNMSSVSQSQYPATIGYPSNYQQFQYAQQQQHGGQHHQGGGFQLQSRQPNRNSNPLHTSHQQYSGGISYSQIRGNNAPPSSHSTNLYLHNNYQQSRHMYHGGAYPDIAELESIAQTETESTLSLGTENQNEFSCNTSIQRLPPPGRPPSPVTVCSEYPGGGPISPRSSTASVASVSQV